MQVTFSVHRIDDLFTIVQEPVPRRVVCRGLPLEVAREAFADYCNMPVNEVPPIEDGGQWTCQRAIRNLDELF